MTHGVTVALQILVLSVKVRILMGQQKNPERLMPFGVFVVGGKTKDSMVNDSGLHSTSSYVNYCLTKAD